MVQMYTNQEEGGGGRDEKQEVNGQRKSEMLKKKIISGIFVFLQYRICLSVLKLRGKPC